MLELELSEVPNFCANYKDGSWYPPYVAWLQARGWNEVSLRYPLGECEERLIAGYYIASGPAARGFRHSVVYRAGVLAHDPHPSRVGLIEVDEVAFLFPLEPRP